MADLAVQPWKGKGRSGAAEDRDPVDPWLYCLLQFWGPRVGDGLGYQLLQSYSTALARQLQDPRRLSASASQPIVCRAFWSLSSLLITCAGRPVRLSLSGSLPKGQPRKLCKSLLAIGRKRRPKHNTIDADAPARLGRQERPQAHMAYRTFLTPLHCWLSCRHAALYQSTIEIAPLHPAPKLAMNTCVPDVCFSSTRAGLLANSLRDVLRVAS